MLLYYSSNDQLYLCDLKPHFRPVTHQGCGVSHKLTPVLTFIYSIITIITGLHCFLCISTEIARSQQINWQSFTGAQST